MNKNLQQTLEQVVATLADYPADEIADVLESLARQQRQTAMSQHQQDTLEEIRRCYQAQPALCTHFYAPDGVNLVNLTAHHWIEELPPPQPATTGYTNHQELPYHDPNDRANRKLRLLWMPGTPYRITTYGYLSLAYGYLFYGLALGDIIYGSDQFRERSTHAKHP